MRLPLSWLKEYIDLRLRAEELAEQLTMAGLEVTAITRTTRDALLELEITPNRPDWLSIMGVAREVAAITGARLKLPPIPALPASQRPAALPCHVDVTDRAGCRQYLGRLITGVRV